MLRVFAATADKYGFMYLIVISCRVLCHNACFCSYCRQVWLCVLDCELHLTRILTHILTRILTHILTRILTYILTRIQAASHKVTNLRKILGSP
jgi:dolichyl-phosphate-mannose--protein O-mannosyl transferase